MLILLSEQAASFANEVLYNQNGCSDLHMDWYFVGTIVTEQNILTQITETETLVEGVDYKRPELKVYWMPNPPCKPFEFVVLNFEEAKAAYNILSYLDLDGQETKALEYGVEGFRTRLTNAYKAYRRNRGINSAWLIDCNLGGLLYKTVDGEWEEFTDEFGYQFGEIIYKDEE